MDSDWYRCFIAKVVLFRAVQNRVSQTAFQAYQANITVHNFSMLASRLGDRTDLDAIWGRQGISGALETMMTDAPRSSNAS